MADGSNRPSYGAHPDAKLRVQKMAEKAKVVADLGIACAIPWGFKEGDKPEESKRRSGLYKSKVCPGCYRRLGPLREWFGRNGSFVFCTSCRPNAQNLKRRTIPPTRKQKAKTCPACLVEYPKTSWNFGPSGTWAVCFRCREKAGGSHVSVSRACTAIWRENCR